MLVINWAVILHIKQSCLCPISLPDFHSLDLQFMASATLGKQIISRIEYVIE